MFGRNDTPAKATKPVDVADRTAAAKPKARAKAKPKAAAKAKAPARSDDPVVLAAFEQGRAARSAAISREDAPHGEGEAKKQWLKGYDFNG